MIRQKIRSGFMKYTNEFNSSLVVIENKEKNIYKIGDSWMNFDDLVYYRNLLTEIIINEVQGENLNDDGSESGWKQLELEI